MHKNQHHAYLANILFKEEPFLGTLARPVEMPFGEEKASRVTRSPATRRSALLAGPVQPLQQELLKKLQAV